MTNEKPDDLDRALEGFVSQWPKSAFADSPDQKTLLIGNLRGFVAFLHILGLGELLDRLAYDIDVQNVATGTVTRWEKFQENVAKIDTLISMQKP